MDKNEKQSPAAASSSQEKPRQEKPRPTREEIMERKISMAKEKNTRVAKIDSPLGGIIFNIMRQFDQAYDKFKGKLGEFGGTSHDKGIVYMQKAQEVTLMFSELTEELSKEVGFKYYMPQELQEFQKIQKVADGKKDAPSAG
jgi:hypothetical protein